jgi:hypothetical protein
MCFTVSKGLEPLSKVSVIKTPTGGGGGGGENVFSGVIALVIWFFFLKRFY